MMPASEKSVASASPDESILDPEKLAPPEPTTREEAEDESEYLSGIRLGLIVLGLCLCVLLVGLDNSILATAIPTITTAFNSLDDVGWYGSAFLICVCALQPLSGKFYQYFSLKWTYISFIATFEVGSLICALAVNSKMLIIGRAVAGSGAAGLFSGALIILSHSIPLRQRPIYTGCIASMFGVSNVVGPILGGVFTQHVSWRWCFYINLPLGAVTLIILALFFHPKTNSLSTLPVTQKIKHLDLPGLGLFIPAVVMLLLAVQWGGNKHAWKSATIIGLIVGSFIILCVFAAWEWRQGDGASIPSRIMGQRNVYSASAMGFLAMGAVQLIAYYIPIWFQVIKDNTPEKSGIRLIPFVLGNFAMSIIAGGLVTKFGYYYPWLFFGTAVLTIASGIFSTWKVDTQDSMINGIQVLAGFGAACVIQMPIIALMSLLPQRDLPIATSIIVFFQFFGGAIFLAIAENIFVSKLISSLHNHVPSVDAKAVVAAGAEGLRRVVSVAQLEGALLAYDEAIMGTFYLGVAGAGAAFLFAFGIERGSVKGVQNRG